MAHQEVTIKCGLCKVPLEGTADAKPNDVFACPRCGRSDSVENILAEAEESAADQVAGQLDDMLAKAFRGSKNVKVTKGARPQKLRRFIVELDR